jgi:hypothetical protein
LKNTAYLLKHEGKLRLRSLSTKRALYSGVEYVHFSATSPQTATKDETLAHPYYRYYLLSNGKGGGGFFYADITDRIFTISNETTLNDHERDDVISFLEFP